MQAFRDVIELIMAGEFLKAEELYASIMGCSKEHAKEAIDYWKHLPAKNKAKKEGREQ